MSFDLHERIRRHSREEWRQLAKDKFVNLRIWIQEHGEQAAIVSLIAGVLLVVFFEVFVWLALIGAALAGAGWLYAEPESTRTGAPPESKGGLN